MLPTVCSVVYYTKLPVVGFGAHGAWEWRVVFDMVGLEEVDYM